MRIEGRINTVILTGLFFCFSITGKSQTDERIFSNLSSGLILNRLYDDAQIQPGGLARWKPNYYERITFPVGDDGYCSTSLDTLIYFNDGKSAVAVLVSYSYLDCHACKSHIALATFEKQSNGQWRLNHFLKDIELGFGWNETGEFAIENFGNDFYCLRIKGFYDGGQGYFSGDMYFYLLNSSGINLIFSYPYSQKTTGALEEGGYEENIAMRKILSENVPTIELTLQRDNKTVSKAIFKYSEEAEWFLETE